MARRKKSPPEVGQRPHAERAWQTVVVLGIAAKEGYQSLSAVQYLHLKELVKQLVGFGRRDFDSNLTIAPLGDFWELKDKGGVLGRKNMRVYFRFHPESNEVVVLHTYKKEDDGQAPPHVFIRLNNRWRSYQNGLFTEDDVIRYQRPEA